MRPGLLDLACCPACGGRLDVAEPSSARDEIVTGSLSCAECARAYPVRDRLPMLYVTDDRWAPKAREADGWVRIHKKQGIYEQPPDAVDLKVPYYPEEPWKGVARYFDAALELMKLTGRETVLDLGAGRGWAAKHFALHGCRAIAIEITSDDQVGIGRAYALMRDAGVVFDPVVGDNERLPFPSNTFDWVFGAAVLHHTSDLPAVADNAFRVLKPGGRLIAINEPCIGVNEDPRAVLERDAQEELAFGINEQRPNHLDYHAALSGSGFEGIEIFPLDSYRMSDVEVENWAEALGAIPARMTRRGTTAAARRFLDWVRTWQASRREQGRVPRPSSRRAAVIQAILAHSDRGVIIQAKKPA